MRRRRTAAGLSALAIAGIAVVVVAALYAGPARAEGAALTGVVQMVDLDRLVIALTSERGVAHALSLARPEVAAGIGKGDRVLIELDGEGRVQKIVKADVPSTRDLVPRR